MKRQRTKIFYSATIPDMEAQVNQWLENGPVKTIDNHETRLTAQKSPKIVMVFLYREA